MSSPSRKSPINRKREANPHSRSGTKKTKYLEENVAAVNVKITQGEEAEIRAAIDKCVVHGGRYPE